MIGGRLFLRKFPKGLDDVTDVDIVDDPVVCAHRQNLQPFESQTEASMDKSRVTPGGIAEDVLHDRFQRLETSEERKARVCWMELMLQGRDHRTA